MADRLYLDHAATTPLLPAAREAVASELAHWANPSSPHEEGRAARARLEEARKRIGRALDWPHELIFTSGSSEAIDIALGRSLVERMAVSAVEHDAVMRAAGPAKRLPVDGNGLLRLDTVQEWLEEAAGKPLVAVQHVNNETGVIQPVDEIARLTEEAGAIFFCDAAQSAGKLPLPHADMISLAAHKLGGPPGIGALLVRDLSTLSPSGGQEKGYRGGTENLPAASGFAAAIESDHEWLDRINKLRSALEEGAREIGVEIVAEASPRVPTIGAYRLPGKAASAQLIRFDMAGIAVSAGSACSSGTLKTSAVLSGMGMDDKMASEVIRISFGPDTGPDAVDRVLSVWKDVAA